jgi:hypothetical protein
VVPTLSVALYVSCLALAALATWYFVADRLMDDRLLLLAAVVEVGLLVQAGIGLAQGLGRGDDWEKVVFFAYLFSVLLVPPSAAILAIKEKTRSGMALMLLAAGVIAVFVARLGQIWGTGA